MGCISHTDAPDRREPGEAAQQDSASFYRPASRPVPRRSAPPAQADEQDEHLGTDVARWLEGSAVVVYVRAHTHRCPDCNQDWTCLALECGPFGAPDPWTGVPSCGWATCPDCEGPRFNGSDFDEGGEA